MARARGVVAASLLLFAAAAWAGDGPSAGGKVVSRAYEPLAPGSAVVVESAQNTDQYQRLKATIEAALTTRGYRVVSDGPLVLEFYASEVQDQRAVDKPSGSRVPSQLPQTDPNLRTGILDGLNKSLFGNEPRSEDLGAAPQPRQVHLSMTLTDWSSSRRIWQGSAAGDMRRPDTFAATQALVPFLVGKLGQTSSGDRFDMP